MKTETTTIRISEKTKELLKELKSKKSLPMNSIIHTLAENELKLLFKMENDVEWKK